MGGQRNSRKVNLKMPFVECYFVIKGSYLTVRSINGTNNCVQLLPISSHTFWFLRFHFLSAGSKQLRVMFRQLYLVISPVFSAVELLRLNPIQTLIFWKTPLICKYYAWVTCGQTTSHLKGEWFLKVINKEAGKSKTHSQQTQSYKKSNFRMRTGWNKIFYIYHTCSVFVDLLSKQMLARYKRTYMGTPYLFSTAQVPFLSSTYLATCGDACSFIIKERTFFLFSRCKLYLHDELGIK